MLRKMFVLTVTLGLAGLVGCSTTRQERSKNASTSMRELNQLLSQAGTQTEKLQASVDKLVKAGPDDLRKAYEQFAKDAGTLRSLAGDARAQGKAMKKSSEAYFSSWEKELSQISNSDLKKMSKERQALLQGEYGDIAAAMSALGKAYTAYEKDLADMERFLGNDLTRAGSELAKPFLTRLNQEADTVQSATRKAQAAISHLETVLKPK